MASRAPQNVYEVGHREPWEGSGLYCEAVLSRKQPLVVPDARLDPEWDHNPDLKLGMVSYLGFPVMWPDKRPFGTICVLDNKHHLYTEDEISLIRQFRDLVESHLVSTLADSRSMRTPANTRYDHLLALLPNLVYECSVNVTSGKVRLHYMNEGGVALFELSEPELPLPDQGLDRIDERVHPDDRERVHQALMDGSTNLTPFHIQHRVVLPGKGLLWVDHRAEPTGQADGAVLWRGVISDITEEMVSVMQRSGDTLLVIINDILDYSKVQAGKMRLNPVPFSLNAIIRDTVSLLAGQAGRKDLLLEHRLDPALELRLLGDASRIRQVVINLVGNAVKFTEHGTVKVSTKAVDESSAGIRIRLEVQDTGIGIPKAVQFRLFKSFSQGDGSASRKFCGTGLGLAICDQLVDLMEGDIGFESSEGQGATFWFEITLQRLSDSQTLEDNDALVLSRLSDDVDESEREGSLRLLLVEDNETNQRVATLLLEQLGHQIVVAASGQKALQLLACERFDAVLMDCQMPEMDGYETTRLIRMGIAPGLDSQVPIIALTASGMPGAQERCLTAGMNDYALKPLTSRVLTAAFARCGLSLPGGRSGQATESRDGGSVSPKASDAALPVLDPAQLE